MTLGPLQVLVVAFGTGAEPTGAIAAELRRLREHDIVRLADLRVVSKDHDGTLSSRQVSDLDREESARLGELAGALVGLGTGTMDEEVPMLADAIPPGTSAAVAVLEHRWAIPLHDAIHDNDGGIVMDAWLQPGPDRPSAATSDRAARSRARE
jgi:uncharacterized membrane protein